MNFFIKVGVVIAVGVAVVLGGLYLIGVVPIIINQTCAESGCFTRTYADSDYCYDHKPSSNSEYHKNNSSSYSYSSGSSGSTGSGSAGSGSVIDKPTTTFYDDGYEDVFDNEDYDDRRYNEDSDYASGVDDALEDWLDEYGEDW